MMLFLICLIASLIVGCNQTIYSRECVWYKKPLTMSERAKNNLSRTNREIILGNKMKYDIFCN